MTDHQDYSPDQGRDEHGRFGSGTGDRTAKGKRTKANAKRAKPPAGHHEPVEHEHEKKGGKSLLGELANTASEFATGKDLEETVEGRKRNVDAIDARTFRVRVARTGPMHYKAGDIKSLRGHEPIPDHRAAAHTAHRDEVELQRVVDQLPGTPVTLGHGKDGRGGPTIGEVTHASYERGDDGAEDHALATVKITDGRGHKAIDAGTLGASLACSSRLDADGFVYGSQVHHVALGVAKGRGGPSCRVVDEVKPLKRVDRVDSADSPRRVMRFDLAPLQPAVEMPNGSLRVQAYLTRCGIFSYAQPDGSIRRELRLPEDVLNPKSLASFQGVPFTNDHPAEMISPENATEFAVGAVDGDVQADDDHVRGTITVWDKSTIAEMRAGKTDVSCGYVCDLLEEPGVHPIYGAYDARQINVIGNHLSLVDVGRAGDAHLRVDRMDSATHRPHTISTVAAPRATGKALDMASKKPKNAPRADALKGAEDRSTKRTANAWREPSTQSVAPISENSRYRAPKLDAEGRAAKRMRDRTANAWRHDLDRPTDPDDNSTRGLRGATAAVRDPEKVPDVSDASLIEVKGLIATFGAYDESVREKLYQPLVDRARELGLDQLADDFENRYGLFDPSDEEQSDEDTDELKRPLQQLKGRTGDRADAAVKRVTKVMLRRADSILAGDRMRTMSADDRATMLDLLGEDATYCRGENDTFIAAFFRHTIGGAK